MRLVFKSRDPRLTPQTMTFDSTGHSLEGTGDGWKVTHLASGVSHEFKNEDWETEAHA